MNDPLTDHCILVDLEVEALKDRVDRLEKAVEMLANHLHLNQSTMTPEILGKAVIVNAGQ